MTSFRTACAPFVIAACCAASCSNAPTGGNDSADLSMSTSTQDMAAPSGTEDLSMSTMQDFAVPPGSDLSMPDMSGEIIDMAGWMIFDLAMKGPDSKMDNCRPPIEGACGECMKMRCNAEMTACMGPNWQTMDTPGSPCEGFMMCNCKCGQMMMGQNCFNICLGQASQQCQQCMSRVFSCVQQSRARDCPM